MVEQLSTQILVGPGAVQCSGTNAELSDCLAGHLARTCSSLLKVLFSPPGGAHMHPKSAWSKGTWILQLGFLSYELRSQVVRRATDLLPRLTKAL